MKVTAVEAIPYCLVSDRPVKFANGEVRGGHHVLVRVHGEDGHVGVAEASPRPMTYGDSPASVIDAIDKLFAPALVGLNILRVERFRHATRHVVHNHTARAALDIALWDLRAKARGERLADLLGGFAECVDVAHLLSLGSPAEVAAEATEVRERWGVKAFKIKVGLDPARDVEIASAVHAALGDDVCLYLDANHGYDAPTALRVANTLRDAGVPLAWFEEPSPAAAMSGRTWLSQHLPLPVAGDESCASLADAAREIRLGHVQLVALKAARTGFTESAQIIAAASALGAELVVGSQLEGALGAAANLSLAAAFSTTVSRPVELTYHLQLSDDIVRAPLSIVNGKALVPDAPGLGLEVDPDGLARLRLD